jgi:hypothetical protein
MEERQCRLDNLNELQGYSALALILSLQGE